MALYFSRNVKVYLQQGSNIWEIPVLDGFSFSQSVNSSDITLAEGIKSSSDTRSRRSRRTFNDSYSPAEWSFSTYIRPFQAGPSGDAGSWEVADADANHHAVEEALWANFVAKNSLAVSTGSGESAAEAVWDNGIANTTSNMTIDFTGSDVAELGEFDLFFVFDETTPKTYKIAKCCVNEATVEFDVEGIATINWSGFGSDIIDSGVSKPNPSITEEITSTDNFIRNRLTKLTLTANDTAVFAGSTGAYSVVLTGGSLTFSNNITYLTPETLGRIDKPMGHVTGTREVGGNFTCYLDSTDNSMAELFQELIDNDNVVTNSFNLVFDIGGSASTPNVKVTMPQAHIEIPTHSIEDVISLDVNFQAQTSSFTPATATAANWDASIVYTGNANS